MSRKRSAQKSALPCFRAPVRVVCHRLTFLIATTFLALLFRRALSQEARSFPCPWDFQNPGKFGSTSTVWCTEFGFGVSLNDSALAGVRWWLRVSTLHLSLSAPGFRA